MISSQRLVLKPLSHNKLIKFVKNDGSLEAELKLNPSKKTFTPELSEALTETILPNVLDAGKDHLLCTLWAIILKTESRIIGDICFVGKPDENGEIEIGYRTDENFRGNGYMTEAIACLLEWLQLHKTIKSVFAQTSIDNPASSKVLEKNNFQNIGKDDEVINWKWKIRAQELA